MIEEGRFLTIDLGAESGRAVLGNIANDRLQLHDLHRFANEPQWILGNFHWDTVRLFADIKIGIRLACHENSALDGIGIDTWGVDFALLNARDECLGLPYHYRDHRTDGVMEKTFDIVPRSEIYNATGIQFMQLNSIFQLMAMRLENSGQLDQARSLLFTPDLLHFWLTGEKANEFTIATTSQCFDPVKNSWAIPVLEKLGIPTSIFGNIIQPGTVLGPLHSSVRNDTGAGPIPVIVPATHDTGSAVAGVPAKQKSGWAYISCGTWSLVGIETPAPIITELTFEYNFTNEGGVDGTYRLLRNVMGLWLLQQCRRSWERAGNCFDYSELAALTAKSEKFVAFVDPDSDAFFNPLDMPAAIADFCWRTGQTVPVGPAAISRCIIESLALKFCWVIAKLEEITGNSIDTIHIIGGGCRNRELCQATADATSRRVVAGPVEATAAGNIMVQAIAAGKIGDIAEGRAMIARSFEMEEYLPIHTDAWAESKERFQSLIGR